MSRAYIDIDDAILRDVRNNPGSTMDDLIGGTASKYAENMSHCANGDNSRIAPIIRRRITVLTNRGLLHFSAKTKTWSIAKRQEDSDNG